MDRAEALKHAVLGFESNVEIRQLDVTDSGSVTRAVDEAMGVAPVDVLVNNAGYQCWTSIEESTDDDAVEIFETNVAGLLRVTRAILPTMRRRGQGTIVNISSVVGMTGSPFEGLYSASKHAVEALSEALYFELKPFGIRVVVIEPGGYPTALRKNARFGQQFDPVSSPYAEAFHRWRAVIDNLDDGPAPDPSEVAETVVEAVTAPRPTLYWPIGAAAELVDRLRRPVRFETYECELREAIGWSA
jgi:NAD(P)-dependent dehydrogenase (short-subunit alcohol dehydrogenase family)